MDIPVIRDDLLLLKRNNRPVASLIEKQPTIYLLNLKSQKLMN